MPCKSEQHPASTASVCKGDFSGKGTHASCPFRSLTELAKVRAAVATAVPELQEKSYGQAEAKVIYL